MQKHRIFERFGFDLPKVGPKDRKLTHLTEYDEWIFEPERNDWIEQDTDTPLVNYTLPTELRQLLAFHVNTILE